MIIGWVCMPLLSIRADRVLRVLALAIALQMSVGGFAFADWDYWLERGQAKIPKCDGGSPESFVKLANRDGQWIYIDGTATCKDAGEDYVYHVQFIRVGINNSRVADITREVLAFDWLGLALYKKADNGQQVDWLYDEAKPLQGSLPKSSTKRIVFGNLEFKVPKAIASRATRFTFYLTAQGVPFIFGAL